MEYNSLLHSSFAAGRIENNLPPAPRRMKRPLRVRVQEALSVLAGRSVGIRWYEDIEVPKEHESCQHKPCGLCSEQLVTGKQAAA